MGTELLLGLLALVASLMAAIVGFGGGMMLIAVMPQFFAPSLVIPIHAVTQIASNVSRVAFSFSDVRWSFFYAFFIGSVAGICLFGLLLFNIPTHYIPLAIGIYILLKTWCQQFLRIIEEYENLYLLGFLQTGLGIVVGSTGPLALSYLANKLTDRNQIIATSAMFMTFSHVAKIPIFGMIGVSLWEHKTVVLIMVAGSVMGSWLGTKIRRKFNNERLLLAIKWLLTALAINMIARVLL
ncbi:sulfite exporter TauE/SafE family protein [Endozoicomonas sp.]|uniref:sulfite exporter TauE/SafE family protein n=1 Tax=Endozoicomonas sp. TaxID=1892382 RepID=UPI003AF5CA94